LAGLDLNGDGQTVANLPNDRFVDPATGQQVSVNSERGDPFVQLDVRATKFLTLGGREGRRLGVFAEIFNVFNTANFGDVYQGNARSPPFSQPVGFLGGRAAQNSQVTYPFTIQLGACAVLGTHIRTVGFPAPRDGAPTPLDRSPVRNRPV
jgi:hypothetical protein